jgi:hypothetical protein
MQEPLLRNSSAASHKFMDRGGRVSPPRAGRRLYRSSVKHHISRGTQSLARPGLCGGPRQIASFSAIWWGGAYCISAAICWDGTCLRAFSTGGLGMSSGSTPDRCIAASNARFGESPHAPHSPPLPNFSDAVLGRLSQVCWKVRLRARWPSVAAWGSACAMCPCLSLCLRRGPVRA